MTKQEVYNYLYYIKNLHGQFTSTYITKMSTGELTNKDVIDYITTNIYISILEDYYNDKGNCFTDTQYNDIVDFINKSYSRCGICEDYPVNQTEIHKTPELITVVTQLVR